MPAARLASSAAMALTTFLMVLVTGRVYGTSTALAAGVLYLLMPRVIGHSRIAGLETLTTLAWFAALYPLMIWWTRERPPTVLQAAISGALWGLLMLTKIQGVFLPPVINVFAFWQLRMRAFVPLSIMAVSGMAVFFGGWPWLWLDPVNNLTSYLMSTTDRLVINNWYLAERYEDRNTPFHFPFVMMAVTVPLSTVCCLGLRLIRWRLDSIERLLLVSVVIPMLVFAWPGTPVYDGTRLFLFVTPALSILSARGLMLLLSGHLPAAGESESAGQASSLRMTRPLVLIAGLLLLTDVVLTIPRLGPFAGDAYNVVGRLLPAESETFEVSYWEDALNGDFWEQVPEGSTVAVAPVLHGVRLQDLSLIHISEPTRPSP